MEAKKQELDDERLYKAIAHPLRFRILVMLNEAPSSAIKIADKLRQPSPKVSYHINVLRDLGAIELASTQKRRGAVELTYRAIVRPHISEKHWSRLPLSARRHLQDQSLQSLWEHVVEAAQEGELDDPRAFLTWVDLDLDQEGYRAMTALLDETLDRAYQLQAEAAGRLSGLEPDERQTQRTELALLHFGRPRVKEKARARGPRATKKLKA